MSSQVEVSATGGIGPELIEALRASLTPFAVAPGELLFRQNDPADGMHVIAQGRGEDGVLPTVEHRERSSWPEGEIPPAESSSSGTASDEITAPR